MLIAELVIALATLPMLIVSVITAVANLAVLLVTFVAEVAMLCLGYKVDRKAGNAVAEHGSPVNTSKAKRIAPALVMSPRARWWLRCAGTVAAAAVTIIFAVESYHRTLRVKRHALDCSAAFTISVSSRQQESTW